MASLPPYSRASGSQAETPGIEFGRGGVVDVSGYQRYQLRGRKIVSAKPAHLTKYALIRPYLLANFKEHRIVDIGCSAGVLGVQAALDGCRRLAFLDHDSEYADVVRKVMGHLGHEVRVIVSPLGRCAESFDVGFALALIHWIYSYSENSGSLDRAVGMLHKIAPEALFVEWVAPGDSAIREAKHIEQNAGIIAEPYNEELFQAALARRYRYITFVGAVSQTRAIWLASQEKPLVSPSAIADSLRAVERINRGKKPAFGQRLAFLASRCRGFFR